MCSRTGACAGSLCPQLSFRIHDDQRASASRSHIYGTKTAATCSTKRDRYSLDVRYLDLAVSLVVAPKMPNGLGIGKQAQDLLACLLVRLLVFAGTTLL